MPLSNPFRRTADRPSLRERAAALRASFRPAAPVKTTPPAPASAEARAAFHEACHQHGIRTAHLHDCPELMRGERDVWSTQSLMQALEAGEIGAAEYARLHPLASERELRFTEIAHDLNIGALFALAYADEYPVLPRSGGDDHDTADTELLRLGRLFEAAREREIAACKACNAASREAQKHMPGRPGALLYRASDHALYLHKHYTNPEYLDGREITSDDVEWVSRKRHTRDVRRPVRPEDKLPADAQFVVGREPWPEAQDRADEIVAAWKAWHADRNAVYAAHDVPRLEDNADKASDATAALAERLAAIPADTANGFRLKLRALAHYRCDVLNAEVEDEADPDQILSHSLWRDVQGKMPAAFDAEAAPATASIIPFGPDAHIAELAAEFCEAYARNIRADRASMAGQITEQEWLPHYEAAKALMERLEATEPKTMLGMALKCLGPIGAAGYNAPADRAEVQVDAWDRVGAQFADAVFAGMLAPLPISEPGPVDLLAAASLDLSRLSLRDVAALHDVASTLTHVVRAMQCQPRSGGGSYLNDVGKFTDWLGDQLDAQIDSTIKELRGREPADWIERDIRLGAIAEATVANGDPVQTASFARELLAQAEAKHLRD